MARENRKSLSLQYSDFDIAGNVFRAWHDSDDNLIFIIDETIDEYKPNVLLVLNPDDDRKWDDILVNDYNVDLEDVRPKKDNKYQKLDIEYDGLDIYDALIRAYSDGKDLDTLLADLIDFRDAAIRRAATARLNSALEVIDQANETIRRAQRSLSALRDRRRTLRNRLARQKEDIGREPTKESAAKILRTESQLESNALKLSRAQTRIDNANHRIDLANADADAARELLSRRRPDAPEVVPSNKPKKADKVSLTKKKTHVLRNSVQSVQEDKQDSQNNNQEEAILPVPDYDFKPREDKMPDSEEVKPLFDKDPEILDEEIAFKPVEFDEIKSSDQKFDETTLHHSDDKVTEPEYENYTDVDVTRDNAKWQDVARDDYDEGRNVNEYDDYAGTRDIARPQEIQHDASEYETERFDTVVDEPEPVLDTIKSVEKSTPADVDTTGRVDNTQYSNIGVTRPMSPAAGVSAPVAPTRPISPITGNEPVRPVGEQRSRSTFAYYLLLILLIALSVFTLWLYQKKNGGALPFLNAVPENMIETSRGGDFPDIDDNVTAESDASVSIDIVPEPEPDIPVVLPEPVPVDKPIDVRYPNEDVLRAAEPTPVTVESEEDVLARKDPYYVSRDDQVVYVPVEPEPEVHVTNLAAPSVIYDDDIAGVPVPGPEYDDAEYYYEDTAAVYQPSDNQYYETEYSDEQSGGFVGESEGFYNEYGPETRRHLSVHDGGQYSISYDETTY